MRAYGHGMTTHAVTPRESCDALLTRLDRISASAETLRAIVGHTDGMSSPSVPALLRDLERDLAIASRDIVRVRDSVRG
jgi:hypothetical protein